MHNKLLQLINVVSSSVCIYNDITLIRVKLVRLEIFKQVLEFEWKKHK